MTRMNLLHCPAQTGSVSTRCNYFPLFMLKFLSSRPRPLQPRREHWGQGPVIGAQTETDLDQEQTALHTSDRQK